jgi:hypothetical protein
VAAGVKASFGEAAGRLGLVAQREREKGLKRWVEQVHVVFAVLADGSVPVGASTSSTSTSSTSASTATTKPQPSISQEGHKWIIQNYRSASPQLPTSDPLPPQSSLIISDCHDTTLTVPPSKIAAIQLDRCTKFRLILQADIIASVDLVNCKRVEVVVQGGLPNLVVEACEAVSVVLGEKARRVKIVSSRSAELNVVHPVRWAGTGACTTSSDTTGDTTSEENVTGTGDATGTTNDQDQLANQEQDDQEPDTVEVAIPVQFLSYFDDHGKLVTEPVQHAAN